MSQMEEQEKTAERRIKFLICAIFAVNTIAIFREIVFMCSENLKKNKPLGKGFKHQVKLSIIV